MSFKLEAKDPSDADALMRDLWTLQVVIPFKNLESINLTPLKWQFAWDY